jgi:hypothetical protein
MFHQATFLPNGQLVGIDRGPRNGVVIASPGFNPSPFIAVHGRAPSPFIAVHGRAPSPFIAVHAPQQSTPLIMRGGCGVPGCDERHLDHICGICGIKNSHRARHCPTITGHRTVTVPPPCRYGVACRNTNDPNHLQKYAHPFSGGVMHTTVMTIPCRYGASCRDTSNPGHLRQYSHPSTRCIYGASCYRKNPDHLRMYSHP